MTTEPPIPASPSSPRDGVRRRQCAVALAAAAAACLAPVAVLLALLVFAPSLLPRLLLRPHHVVPYVATADLHRLAFDPAASAVTYNLSATLRFDSPCMYCVWRYAGLRAAPSYAGQQLGAAAALPELTQRRGGSDAREVAWAGTQKVPPGRRARAVAAALSREEAQGRLIVKVAVSTLQNGARSDFACVLSFPAVSVPRRGESWSGSAVFDGGRCIDAVPGEI